MLTLSTQPNAVAFVGNPLIFHVLAEEAAGTPYTPITFPALHRVDIEIAVENVWNSGTFTVLGAASSRVSDDLYRYVFDVSDTILDFFQNSFKNLDKPIFNTPTFLLSNVRRYRVVLTEKNGATTIDSTTQIKIGVFGRSEEDYSFPATGWMSVIGNKRFVDLTKHVLLTYFNNTDSDIDFEPKFTLFGLNNEVLTIVQGADLPFFIPSIPARQAMTFNLGSVDFGVAYPLSSLGKIVFEDTNASIAPITLYNFVESPDNNRVLLYRNRFGAMESLICSGEIVEEKEVNRYEAVTAGNFQVASQYYGHRRQYDVDVATNFTFKTGYIKKIEKEALSDMFVINDVWYFTNEKYIPLRLIDNKFEKYDSFEDLTSWTFRAAVRNKSKI